MTLHWTDIAVLLALIVTGCSAALFIAARLTRRSILGRQAEIERTLHSLTDAVQALEARLSKPRDTFVPASSMPEAQTDLNGIATEAQAESDREEIAPEILAAITAAAHAFLGKRSRLRSVRPLASQQGVSQWSQQGRVFVQASHNLRSRR